MTRDVHAIATWIVVLLNAAAGAWALAAHWLVVARVRQLWWLTIAAQVAVFPYVAAGAALASQDASTEFFLLYDVSAVVAVLCLYAWRASMWHRLYLMYGLGSWFIMGLGIRTLVLVN